MKYQGIIISGTSNQNCQEIAKSLEITQSYKVVRVVSSDNAEKYGDYIAFEKLSNIDEGKFFIKKAIDNVIVAIFLQEFHEIIESNVVPVMVIRKEFVHAMIEEFQKAGLHFLSFYVNDGNEEMGNIGRECANKIERTFHYCLNNKSFGDVVALIDKLWDLRERGGGLSRDIIELLMKCDLLIEDGKLSNVSNSSYDLTLGDEYYYAGEIEELSEKKPFIAIEPYDYVIASCDEKIIMPRDISGRFDVSVNLFCQGIILSNSTQVDPGFRGKLFCLLFNTSNKVVYLKRHMHFTTMDFNKLIEPTTAYSGKYADEDSIVPYLPTNIMQGAINELKKEIEGLKSENKTMQGIYLSVLALFLAIISILLVLK